MQNERTSQIFRLTPPERENPNLAFQDIFNYANLTDQKEMLWEWFTIAITSSNAKRKITRENLIFCYEQMEKLVEAAHLINERAVTLNQS